MPPAVARQRNNVIKVLGLKLINKGLDLSSIRRNPICLITGDGNTLQAETREFESWGVPHDLYAVNRSLIFHRRPVDHWAAIDIEESCWFTENVNKDVQNGRQIMRHTIGEIPMAYDIWWEMDYAWENDFQRRVFVGNTGYFAVLTALAMGYKKIVLAGMPLDRSPHWYEPEATTGPNWNGLTYTQWMDFKIQHQEAEKVRSFGGYSAFILGKVDKDWLNADR
jgi:hypothetical protein